MHLLSTKLLFWACISAASLVAAALVVTVEVRATVDDCRDIVFPCDSNRALSGGPATGAKA